jgi:hypothetical protein
MSRGRLGRRAGEPGNGPTPSRVTPGASLTEERPGRSFAVKPDAPGWPRLLDLYGAALYVGLSAGMLREYVNDGSLPVTRPVRPNTNRAHGIRAGKRTRRCAESEHVRRLLFDRADLDALVDKWKRRA